MNRVVVLGAIIVAVVVAIIAVGILSANHQNNNYTPTSTTTNNGTSIILNTNTTTPSTTTTSTNTSTILTNTTTNTTTKIHYNTFYFLNQTGQNDYYVFVLNYSEFETVAKFMPLQRIPYLDVNGTIPFQITETYIIGNYVFLIGYSQWPFQPLIGHQYSVMFQTITGKLYFYQFTYEGNWEGPSL
jgi:hypothetical protein